jgi:hypothetical protein
MKLVKTSNLSSRKNDTSQYDKNIDTDISSLFTALKGRLRFGSPTDGYRGENISGEFQVFTSNATPDTEDTVAHTIGAVPVGYIVLKQNKAGSLYLGTTSWTSSNVYFKSNVASVAFTIFLLK